MYLIMPLCLQDTRLDIKYAILMGILPVHKNTCGLLPGCSLYAQFYFPDNMPFNRWLWGKKVAVIITVFTVKIIMNILQNINAVIIIIIIIIIMLLISKSMDLWKITGISSLCSIDKLSFPFFSIFSFLL